MKLDQNIICSFEYQDFIARLLENDGYIIDADLDIAIEVFGEDFIVILRNEFGNMDAITLYELKYLDKGTDTTIKDVRLRSDDCIRIRNILTQKAY